MFQLTCVLEGDYKTLVVLLAALERIGHPIRYSSYQDLANQCTDLVDWPVEREPLWTAQLRMRKRNLARFERDVTHFSAFLLDFVII